MKISTALGMVSFVFLYLGLLAMADTSSEESDLSGRAGGWKHVNVSEPYVQEITQLAYDRVERGCNCLYRHKLLKVVKAKQQVVAGLKTEVTFHLTQTNCRKGTKKDIEQCEGGDQASKECVVVVWDKPWLKERKILSSECKEVPHSRQIRETTPSKGIIGGDDHDMVHLGMFKDFMKKYNRTYTSKQEYKYRYHVFAVNMKKVRELQKYEQGTATYGATAFADYTEKEFKQYFTGLRPELQKSTNAKMARIPAIRLPTSFDWRDHNTVTPVKNQGMCGSCWAFSTTGNVEGQWAISKGQLVSLSEQELVDCDTLDSGCNGGLMTNAFDQIVKLGGLEGESDYPYEGHNDKCQMNQPLVKASIQSYVNISQNETEMAQWLVKNGPIAVGINANAMQFYFGGVSHPWKFLCSPDSIDHGVLIVGFGESKNRFFNKTSPYWVIKNSWGSGWGEQGYYRVYRGDGTCGVNTMASSAVVGA